MSSPGLKLEELVNLSGVGRTTLNYWKNEHGLFEPTNETKDNADSLGYRYDLKATQIVLTAAKLREQGVSFQKVRKAAEALKNYGEDLSSAVLVTDGEEVYLREEDQLLTDLTKRPGQLTTYELMPLRTIAEEAEEAFEERKEAA